jgi:ethanolamine utilization protein EutA
MSRAIRLVGLDCGSTTTSAVVATARLAMGALGRVEIADLEPVFRSPVVFTPFDGEHIDAAALNRLLDSWLAESATDPTEVFGGGALVTGLAAQSANASAITALIESRLADSVIATADDPRLESWLAFMGNCHALSKSHPMTPILNLDIGGGTTNLALGLDGQVLATGCLFVGARHFEFAPGGYTLTRRSPYAAALLAHRKILRRLGDTLTPAEVESIIDFQVELISAAVEGDTARLQSELALLHIQSPFLLPPLDEPPVLTFSGGVGQLIYDSLAGKPNQGPSRFGDLGEELAARLASAPQLASRVWPFKPTGLGRATVLGLLRHSTELSGTTIYLPRPDRLPLKNVPLVGRIDTTTKDTRVRQLLDLAARAKPAGCLRVDLDAANIDDVRAVGGRLAKLLADGVFPVDRTLVLLTSGNAGKALGNYITGWGALKSDVIVIDEVPPREAQFVRIGRLREGLLPLWFYAVQ